MDDDVYIGRLEWTCRLGFGVRPMDIDKLEAGRELDALVAEKVMGWARRMCPPPEGDGLTWISEPEGPGSLERDWCLDDPTLGELPAYSTDIAAAWAVLKEISTKRLGPEYHPDSKHLPKSNSRHGLYKPVIRLELYEHDDEYHVTIGRCKGVGMDDDIVVGLIGGDFDKSIPLLICRAALKAVGA